MIRLADTGRPPSGRGWRLLISTGLIYSVAIAVIGAWRVESSSDFRDFWENAVHLRESGQISADLGVHNYLPFFTIFMLPWGLLPLRVAMVLFTLLSLGLFGVTVGLAENLLNDGWARGPRRPLLIGLALALPYVHSCAVLGNVGLLVLFLLVTTWFLVERGREWQAGVALGLATLIKLLPGLLIVFFLLKRRWRVAGAAAAVSIVLGLGLPLLTSGYEATLAQHRAFYDRVLQKGSALQTITSDKPTKAMYSNNAMPIVLRRLLSPVDGAPGRTDSPLCVNFADLPPRVILAVYLALLAALVGTSVAVTLPGSRPWPPQTLDQARAVRAQFGAWCCLMLLASPLVWTHYLPLVYWPLAFLADRVERTHRARGKPSVVATAALILWLIGALLLAWPAARAAGAQIAAVAGLWLALVVVARERSMSPPRPFSRTAPPSN
jgi:hypothetical protein